MLKGRKKKIPVAVGAMILVPALVGSSVLAMRMTGVFAKLTGQEKAENLSNLTQKEGKSAVLPLVSLPPQQRASQLEAAAKGEIVGSLLSGSNSLDKYRARYLLASDLIEQNQEEAALKWLEGLESDYQILAPQIALKRAQAYEKIEDQAKAEAAWKNILEKYPQQPVAGEALYVLGKSNPDYWSQLIAQFPNHPRTQEIVRQKLKEKPNQLPLLMLLAKYTPNAEGMSGVRDRLMANFASQLTPQDWEVIATGYWDTWEYGKAAQAYAKSPLTARNAYRTGRGFHLKGKRAEARTAYQKLINQFPNAKETGLGTKHLASLSKSEDALVYLDQVINNFPNEAPEALLAKAKILDALGSGKSAGQARQSVLSQYPQSDAAAQYRWQVAERKAAEGKFEEAWKWAQPITTDAPDSSLAPEAAFWVGRWALEIDRQKEAQAAFEHVLATYPESFYAWRSARFLGWDVGDFNTVRYLTPEIVQAKGRSIPPAGSAALKELYQLGQDRDVWALWQMEIKNPQELTVAEQFTDGLMRLGVGDNLKGINQIWYLSRRDTPEEQEEWKKLREEPAYWHALFPFPFFEQVAYWSSQNQLNPLLVTGLIRQESRFEAKIRSVAGATGLMQVMPGTAKWVAQKIDLTEYSMEDPNDNIRLGTWYLDHTHQEYSDNSLLAVASYNAGPGNVAKWVAKYGFTDPDAFIEQIPFPETKGYVETVFGNYWNYLRLYNPEVSKMVAKYSGDKQLVKN
ncbi:MAG: transglycosylase SLT domain-containing protein [Coleofasciculaceae cyanobacterium]